MELTRRGGQGPGATQETWVRAAAGVTSGHRLSVCHRLSPLCWPGGGGGGARCQPGRRGPEKSRCVTFALRCHLLMEVSVKREASLPLKLRYSTRVTRADDITPHVQQIEGRGGAHSLRRAADPPPLSPPAKAVSVPASCCSQP